MTKGTPLRDRLSRLAVNHRRCVSSVDVRQRALKASRPRRSASSEHGLPRRPLRRWGGGSARYHFRHRHLPDGPSTASEFARWPDLLIEALLIPRNEADHDNALRRLHRLLSNIADPGLVCHSDYSGQQCPETALRMLGVALHDFCISRGMSGLPGGHGAEWLVSWRACDNDPLCRKIISEGRWPPEHLVPEIAARMPREIRLKLDKLRPDPSAPESVRQKAFASMSAYLESDEVGDKLASGMWMSKCLSHPGCRCPIAWSKGSVDSTGGVNGDERATPQPQPITINVSGPVCLPWTSFGSRQGRSHMATEPYMLWSLEMRRMRYDVVFFENSSLMPLQEFSSKMERHAETVSVVFSPHELGWPVRRCRLMCAAIDRSSLVWLGPDPSDIAALRAHFLGFFARHVIVDANCFATADTPAKVAAERSRRAAQVGLSGVASATAGVERFFKTAKQKSYIRQYIKMLHHWAGSVSGTVVCDTSQNPAQRPRCSPWLPSPTRTSNFCLLDARKGSNNTGYFFTPAELGLMMGWPRIAAEGCDKFSRCMSYNMDNLSANEQRVLQGNSMHLASVSSFMLWVLSHCLRRDVVREFLPPLRLLQPPSRRTNSSDDEAGIEAR